MPMKPSFIVLMLLLLCLLSAPAGVCADLDGFNGMRWGSNLADLQQTKKLVLTKEGGKSGASLYVLENESLRFGKATLTGINYSFAKDRLQGAILLFSGPKNFAAVKAEAMAKFGETKKIEQSGEEMYNWPGTVTSSILSYNRSTQAGFLFLKVKKMPPQIKTAEKRPPTKAVPETALDKAPPPPRSAPTPAGPAFRPATGQTDLETALDRAPPLPSQPDPARDISPETQVLIDRDQALTQLCWETVGPAADAACVQMRQNVERLKSMGMCMRPGSTDASADAAIVWYRCKPAAPQPQAIPPSAPQAVSPASPAMPAPTPDHPFAGQPLAGQQPLPSEPAAQQQSIPPATPPAGEDKSEHCRLIGELFASAARMRDNGSEPQVAEQELSWRVSSQTPEITIERVRETIELVYFDQEYNAISGEALIQRVSDRCLGGRGPYSRPLR
ncbi:hypothetical protein [Desulfobulbus sp.]|uniref:hypothetical protein n=1 Tax=Desulfobulbus sp. TaxID=895 RepID=UPI00286F28BC|nr:hypothetical protein [Desulfobulbus sp.]